MKEKIVNWYNSLPTVKKRSFITACVVFTVFVIILAVFVSMMSRTAKQQDKQKKEMASGQTDIHLDKHLLDKEAFLESGRKMAQMENDIANLKKGTKPALNADTTQQQSAPFMGVMPPAPAASASSTALAPRPPAAMPQPAPAIPKPAVMPPQPLPQPSYSVPPPPPIEASRETIGGIETVRNTEEGPAAAKDVKKKGLTIYIPASTIIPVTLLSGVDATVMEDAKRPNVPVVLRIDNLAFLPNEFKANLKGCRILAQGIGSLADERVHLRSMSVTCISKTGKAIIDSEIQGYLADIDGKGGVRGTVVSKMDSALWRAFLAGLFGGAGQAIQAQSQPLATVSVGGTTGTQTLNGSQIAQAGIGGGLVSASGELQKFYMELARQMSPTIEVGSLRKLAFVTTKGAELEIKTPNLVR